jgi:hypothetical protein
MLVCRMLTSPKLPGSVRKVIEQYVVEKCAGFYSHSEVQQRHFSARLVVLQREADQIVRHECSQQVRLGG